MSTDFMRDVEEFADLERRRKALESEAAALGPRIAELRDRILATHPATGLGKSFRLASGGTVVFSERVTAKVLDKGACADWFLAHGMKEMLSVHTATLTAFCRQEAEKMAPLPDGVELGSFTHVSIRAS